MTGAIAQKWAALGGVGYGRGLPLQTESSTPGGGGRFAHFDGGWSIYWTPGTGAHVVEGAIRYQWSLLGWERSRLGFPTSDEYSVPGGRRSDFQFGSMTWTAASNAVTVTYR